MAILVDYNQVILASLFASIGNHTDVAADESIIRHMFLNSLRANRKKFTEEYGELRDGIIFNVTKILFCKTEYLGFKNYICAECANTKSVAFTCKGRFCSSCGKKKTDRWISKTTNVLPKTRWQHITFTMPDSLWPMFWFNRFLILP